MRRIDILLASELSGGLAPFRHDQFDVMLHRWTDFAELPLIEGALWVFIDWVLPEMSGLELCRRLRADSLTAHAHVTMVDSIASDHPTDAQVVAMARQYFKNFDQMAADPALK
jgi:CheY-like chemotaxis protein